MTLLLCHSLPPCPLRPVWLWVHIKSEIQFLFCDSCHAGLASDPGVEEAYTITALRQPSTHAVAAHQKKCSCETRELMMYGCKCGGI